jgi:hypothetical protein
VNSRKQFESKWRLKSLDQTGDLVKASSIVRVLTQEFGGIFNGSGNKLKSLIWRVASISYPETKWPSIMRKTWRRFSAYGP